MKKWNSRVTFHYILITAGFWMSFCICSTNAAVYLQGAGYSNAELGLILALGNIGGALFSTLVGDFLDRHPQVRHVYVLHVLCAIQLAALVLMRLHPVSGWAHSIFYVLYCLALMTVNAVNLDLCVRLEHLNAGLNFGFARSFGSLSFMVVSILLGFLVEKMSFLVLLYSGMVIVAFQFVSNLLMDRDVRAAEASAPPIAAESRTESVSLPRFFAQNKAFSVMLLGVMIIFIAHSMDGNFLINEVRDLGGNTVDMGWIAAFQALVEVPVMVLASRLPKKWSYAWYIRLSFLFFVLKILMYALSPSIPFFFAARILQAPSYALYIVLCVPYADMVVPHQDSAKAQGLLVSVTNLGAVIASLIGGAMFDALGSRSTMLIAAAIAALGCAIGFLGAKDERKAAPRTVEPQ